MASREKKALAPQTTTKTKQQPSRANNDTSSHQHQQQQISPKNNNKKGKSTYILDTVSQPQLSATGSASSSPKLTAKLEAAGTRKKVLASLKCKKKLRAVKGNLIKVKNTKNSPVKSLKRINTNKSTKTTTNLRIKKTKQIDNTDIVVPSSDNNTTTTRGSPKTTTRKLKILPDNQLKSAKIVKINRRNIKEENDPDNKYLKSRKLSPLTKNSIDTVIDEVVAMVGDSESDSIMDNPPETKLTRSKKTLDDKLTLSEYEIKKEMIDEDYDDDEVDDFADLKETKRRVAQRSLRNGKLRQGQTDSDLKKARRSETMEDAVDSAAESSCLDESIEAVTLAVSPEPKPLEAASELENNNHGGSPGNDGGPTLRSKTKAKSTDIQLKTDDDDIHVIEAKLVDADKRSLTPAKRRSSLNIDVKKTMGSMYGNEKPDGSKSQIDKMIANIKLTIAKSIESKIFGPECALGLTKNFDNVPKVEEIIVPVTADNQKVVNVEPETSVSDDKSSAAKAEENNINHSSNSSRNADNIDCSDDNGLPKVADTAKEIEKLVMGGEGQDIEAVNNGEASSSRTDDQNISEIIEMVEIHSDLVKETKESQGTEESHENNSEPEKQLEESEESSENSQIEVKVSSDVACNENVEEMMEVLEDVLSAPERSETSTKQSEKSEELPEKEPQVSEDMTPAENQSEDTSEEAVSQPPLKTAESEQIPEPNYINEAATSVDALPPPGIDSEVVKDLILEPSGSSPLPEMLISMAEEQSTTPSSTKSRKSDESVESSLEKHHQKTSENLQKSPETSEKPADEGKRVLRARDKQRKVDKSKTTEIPDVKVKIESEVEQNETEESSQVQENSEASEVVRTEGVEIVGRTRRSREIKRRREDGLLMQNPIKSKRNRRESKKLEQNKEETLLDNEVATINENNQSYSREKFNKRLEGTESLRIFSDDKRNEENDRSKSENDIASVKQDSESIERLAERICESSSKEQEVKPKENSQKDSDEASTSGESMSSVSGIKIMETPEDKARKESIFLLLGLESTEKAAERKKAKSEQCINTGTLKTVIRVPKDAGKEKKRSRSPLKMVLKQGRADGEGDSPEFYTIQKELGTSGLGDSSSGANRKFSTNHRQSCDEETEETSSKDRQSLIIPEKSSSFSIHPGRLCADVCCYCFGKFGSLDTPMHLAQMKSDERKRKILSVERHLTKDSCLCDACYRHVDRKANTSPTNLAKPQRQHRQLMVSKCAAKDCRDPSRHLVKRRWLLKIKSCLQNQLNIDWESSQHTSMSFCVRHYSTIERFLTCAICQRRLARNHTHPLPANETNELNYLLPRQGVPVMLMAGTFVCKLCRYFTQLHLKYKDVENMSTNHRSFSKSYRKRILHYNNIHMDDEDDEGPSSVTPPRTSLTPSIPKEKEVPKEKEIPKEKEKDRKSKKSRYSQSNKQPTPSKSPESNSTGNSEKSSPEPPKTDAEPEARERLPENPQNDQMDLESTVEKLKKRKALDQHLYSTDSPFSQQTSPNVVEILAMDKEEVTLTRLPKKAKLSNDITPVVQRLGANPSISVRTLFPGEEEMGLHANIEFSNVREITPQGWEKCATIIQYDRETKLLWQELQRPYGNQSSFMRHLVLLEKYYRSGDLVLAPNASRNAINYSTSVQNRLISYEGPEKMDEPITEPISEFSSSKRLSGGYVLDRQSSGPIPGTSGVMPLTAVTPVASTASMPTTSSAPSKLISHTNASNSSKAPPSRMLKINTGVSIIKKPPPNLQRLNIPSGSSGVPAANGSAKRKDAFPSKITSNTSGGKVFQLTEPDFKRLQTLKKQKMLNEKLTGNNSSKSSTNQYQKAQIAAQSQFQKHLRMQQEMLNRQSRGDFEPLICDVRSLANENTPAQNLLNNLNLPKSIQVTTKPTNNPIPILPKIPKSLTVIPQTISRPVNK